MIVMSYNDLNDEFYNFLELKDTNLSYFSCCVDALGSRSGVELSGRYYRKTVNSGGNVETSQTPEHNTHTVTNSKRHGNNDASPSSTASVRINNSNIN